MPLACRLYISQLRRSSPKMHENLNHQGWHWRGSSNSQLLQKMQQLAFIITIFHNGCYHAEILIQDDVAEGQRDAAGAFGFDAVDDIGFSGGDGVLPFVAGGAGENDQAALF